MISRRVNSLRDEFYPDFEMVLHNRTLEYPSRKALKLERHKCFIFSPMVLGEQGAKLLFYQCLHYCLQPIYRLWNTIKSTMNNYVKKEDKSLSPWGGEYGPPACLPCVTSFHTNEQKVSYLCLDDTKYAGGTFEKVYWQLQNVCRWAAANNIWDNFVLDNQWWWYFCQAGTVSPP